MKVFFAFIFTIYLINTATAQVVIPKPCPNVQVVQNFDTSKYLGKWFEVEKYFAAFEKGGKCITAVYGDNKDGSISVNNSQIDIETGIPKSSLGSAVVVSSSGDAKLEVTFQIPHKYEKEIHHTSAPKSEGNYWVLDTDYSNYSVIWSCTPAGPNSVQFAWILVRERNPSQSVLQKAYDVFDRYGIDRQLLQTTDHTNCSN